MPADPDILYTKDTLTIGNIYHVTLTYDPLTLNMRHMLRSALG